MFISLTLYQSLFICLFPLSPTIYQSLFICLSLFFFLFMPGLFFQFQINIFSNYHKQKQALTIIDFFCLLLHFRHARVANLHHKCSSNNKRLKLKNKNKKKYFISFVWSRLPIRNYRWLEKKTKIASLAFLEWQPAASPLQQTLANRVE